MQAVLSALCELQRAHKAKTKHGGGTRGDGNQIPRNHVELADRRKGAYERGRPYPLDHEGGHSWSRESKVYDQCCMNAEYLGSASPTLVAALNMGRCTWPIISNISIPRLGA